MAQTTFRDFATGSAVILDTAQDSSVQSLAGHAGGVFVIPAGWTGGATVSFKVSQTKTGTLFPVYDEANVLVTVTVTAGRAYPIPLEVLMAPFFAIRAVGAVTRDETILLMTKS